MHRLPWLAVAVILLLYAGSLDRDLVSPGESRVAQLALEMVRDGHPLVPTYNGRVTPATLTKPPLYHWLVAAVATPFHWQNFSLRLISVASVLAGLWLTLQLGRRLFDRNAAYLAVLVLASAPVFLAYGQSARMDLFFSTLVLAAMTALVAAIQAPGRRAPLALFFAAVGLAMMVKGPAGLVIPVGTALIYGALAEGRAGVRRLLPAWGWALFLVIGLAWYLVIPFLVPPEVARSLFWTEPTNWLEGNAGGIQSRFWYYLPLLLGGLFPWSLFLLVALVAATRRLIAGRDPALLLVIAWFLGGLLLFSLGGKKAIRYLLPILPAAALLVGWYLNQQLARRRASLGAMLSGLLITLLAGLIATALLWGLAHPEAGARALLEGRNPTDRVILAIFWQLMRDHAAVTAGIALAVVALSLGALVALWRLRLGAAVLGYATVAWLLLGVYFHTLLPTQTQLLSPRPMAVFIHAQVGDAPLYGGGNAFLRAMHWYLGRGFDHRPHRELLELIRTDPDQALFLMHKKPLPAELLARPHCSWRTPKYRVTFFPAQGRAPACPARSDTAPARGVSSDRRASGPPA